jgi:hypothetical protein
MQQYLPPTRYHNISERREIIFLGREYKRSSIPLYINRGVLNYCINLADITGNRARRELGADGGIDNQIRNGFVYLVTYDASIPDQLNELGSLPTAELIPESLFKKANPLSIFLLENLFKILSQEH